MTPDLGHAFKLAQGPLAAEAVFAYARAGIHASAGSLLTTASVYDLRQMRSRRVWTDDAAAYPTGNFKRLDRNRYFETVIEGRQPFSSTTIPVTTLPFGRLMLAFSSFCPSASWIGVPGRPGRFAP